MKLPSGGPAPRVRAPPDRRGLRVARPRLGQSRIRPASPSTSTSRSPGSCSRCFAPFAIMILEPPGRRRRLIGGFVVLGAIAGAYLAAAIVRGDVVGPCGRAHGPVRRRGSLRHGGHRALHRRDVRGAVALGVPRHRLVRGRQRRRGRGLRHHPGEGTHLAVVHVGGGRERAHLSCSSCSGAAVTTALTGRSPHPSRARDHVRGGRARAGMMRSRSSGRRPRYPRTLRKASLR